MFKHEPPTEYAVSGSRQLGFDTHPAASIQYLLGGFVPTRSEASVEWAGLARARQELETPVEACSAVSSHFSALRECAEEWKRLTQRILKPEKTPRDLSLFVPSLSECRTRLETECIDNALLIQQIQQILKQSLELMTGQACPLYLGLPDPVAPEILAEMSSVWESRLFQLLALGIDQDPDMPRLMARAQALIEEISDSIKEIIREAKWLWTNELDANRITGLQVWLFDLYCECTEMAPILSCLRTPIEIWQQAVVHSGEISSPSQE